MTSAELPADIRARIVADYGIDGLIGIASELSRYQGPERERVLRCILHLAIDQHLQRISAWRSWTTGMSFGVPNTKVVTIG